MPAEYPVPGPAGPPGPQGPPGPSGSSSGLTHTHSVLEATWTIPHTLGYNPNVTIEDSGGSDVLVDVSYPNLTTVVVSFIVPMTGTAYLS